MSQPAVRRGERRPVIIWSAGEPSGDRHAAEVAAAVARRRPDVRSIGLGGPAMAAAGVELIADMDEVSVVGVTEVLTRLPRIVSVWRRLRARLDDRPTLFVPVDFPGLNLRLAGLARRRAVRVVYYISPQVWAWGSGRLPRMRAVVDRMLVVFSFEVPLYESVGVPVTHVGHPLVEQVAAVPDRATARRELGIDAARRVLVLMPGSRPGELGRLLAPELAAAARLRARHPELEILVRLAPGLGTTEVERAAARQRVPVRIVSGGDARAVRAADLAIVASGTATLETALLGTPMVIVYRVSRLTYAIARRVVRLDSIGLVNVVAGRRVVPELVQGELDPERLATVAGELLVAGAARDAQLEALAAVASRLDGGRAVERTADAVVTELEHAERGRGG